MTDGAPSEVRLTPAAQRDLEAIWRFTAARWSPAQADSYLAGLRDTFRILQTHPRLARERRDLTPPVRIHPYVAHIIIYRIEADVLAVIRVRHRHEDWTSDPVAADD